MFDRFEVLETASVLAWDFGLYGFWEHIRYDLGFTPRRSLASFLDLNSRQQELYRELEERAEITDPWDRRLVK